MTKKSNILSKLRRGRKDSKGSKHLQSWRESGPSTPHVAVDDVDESYANEEELPEPPPVPTVEYLLGKRPVNLRKRASDSLRREMTAHATEDGDDDESDDGHSSVSSSTSDHKRRGKKQRDKKRHKRRGSRGNSDEESSSSVEWNYNKLSVPQSSPPRDRKLLFGVERHPTPIPAPVPPLTNRLPSPLRLGSAFDEVSHELLLLSDVSDTPTSLSPLNSPSPKSPVSPVHISPPPKISRSAPRPPPNLQLGSANQASSGGGGGGGGGILRKASPLSKVVSSRGKAKTGTQKTTLSNKQVSELHLPCFGPRKYLAIRYCNVNLSTVFTN